MEKLGREKGTSPWQRFWKGLDQGCRLADASAEERAAVGDRLAQDLASGLAAEGYGTVGIFLGEALKPASRIMAHALHFFTPHAGLYLGDTRVSNLACLLEDRRNLEVFVERLEELDGKRPKVKREDPSGGTEG